MLTHIMLLNSILDLLGCNNLQYRYLKEEAFLQSIFS